MEKILINLIAGELGGIAAGKSSPTFDLQRSGVRIPSFARSAAG